MMPNSAAHKRHHWPKEGACLSGLFPLSTAKIALNITKPTKPQLAELGKYKVGVSECQILPWIQMVLCSILISWCFFPGLSQTKKKSSWNSSMLEKNSIHASFFLGVDWHTLAMVSKKSPVCLVGISFFALGQSIWQPVTIFSFCTAFDGKLVGGFNPFRKILVKMGIFPR